MRLRKEDLNLLKAIPEKVIKEAFADAINEPAIPNDWGGEQFDLWTTRLRLRGDWASAAFLFKGPSQFHPMDVKSLGARGDQIDRLFSSRADVLVLQHCHEVTSRVVNMMRAYASDFSRPRRFMVIDGYETIKILRHLHVL